LKKDGRHGFLNCIVKPFLQQYKLRTGDGYLASKMWDELGLLSIVEKVNFCFSFLAPSKSKRQKINFNVFIFPATFNTFAKFQQ